MHCWTEKYTIDPSVFFSPVLYNSADVLLVQDRVLGFAGGSPTRTHAESHLHGIRTVEHQQSWHILEEG